MDYSTNTNVSKILSKSTFDLIKQGKAAFPMGKQVDAAEFDSNFRMWMLELCKINSDLRIPSMNHTQLIKNANTLEQIEILRRPIVEAMSSLEQNYKRFLQSVAKAGSHVKPSFFSSIGFGQGYYDKVHDLLFDINKAYLSNLRSALERVDARKSEISQANSKKASNALAARLASLTRKGGKRKTIRRYKKRRQTRRT